MARANIFRDVCGLNLSYIFQEPVVREALAYEPKPGDVFVVSFPKCGSTWMQQIVYAIYHDGAKPECGQSHSWVRANYSGHYNSNNNIRHCIEVEAHSSFYSWRPELMNLRDFLQKSPMLELVGLEAMKNMPRPGAFKTHLPFDRVPYSPRAKYIFVARNPYDCCVSFYHHTRAFPQYRFADGSFDEFLGMFLEGKVDCGDYFYTLLSWYDHIHDDNVLFVTYEKLKAHPSEAVIEIADFLGEEYGNKLRNRPEVMDKILDTISVKTMKSFNEEFRRWTEKAVELTGFRSDEVDDGIVKEPMTGDFVRKAIVGDWKNHFNSEQIARMKETIASKLKECSVMSLWENVDLP